MTAISVNCCMMGKHTKEHNKVFTRKRLSSVEKFTANNWNYDFKLENVLKLSFELANNFEMTIKINWNCWFILT